MTTIAARNWTRAAARGQWRRTSRGIGRERETHDEEVELDLFECEKLFCLLPLCCTRRRLVVRRILELADRHLLLALLLAVVCGPCEEDLSQERLLRSRGAVGSRRERMRRSGRVGRGRRGRRGVLRAGDALTAREDGEAVHA